MIDATPDFAEQLYLLTNNNKKNLKGIFLTHAHIGHYTGLMFLGREVASTKQIPVYAMPRMKTFLEQNGPWSQLVKLRNIELNKLHEDSLIKTLDQLQITPIGVPHRDEFSETVGYSLKGKNKRALYIPDIDKWSKWDQSIDSLIKIHDYVFIDGTFFSDGEIPRPMSEVPHPFIEESTKRFSSLDRYHRNKIYFIHLNHSNPARNRDFQGRKIIESTGMHFANFGDTFTL
jgi:pyrroloquinoline quinone biosynthesis protein B